MNPVQSQHAAVALDLPERAIPQRAIALAWLELTKPRIGLYVILAAWTGAVLAGAGMGTATVVALLVGSVSAGSCVFNHILERDVDALMERTRQRPLVTGEVRLRDAVLFGAALTLGGAAGLAAAFGPLTAALGLGTTLTYALVYTPLKRLSTVNTVVGAIPGAMPPLLGACAVAGTPGAWGWILFAVIFAWQFPHFLAIATIHREDYRRAGMRMLPAIDGSEGMSGIQSLLYALVLIPVSMLPLTHAGAGPAYLLAAALLGLAYAVAAGRFALSETKARARTLLLASLVYLPGLFAAALLDPLVSQSVQL